MDEPGKEGPSGVGGWLAFFCVVIGIFTPVRVLIETIGLHTDPEIAASFGETWSIIASMEWGFSAAQVALCWYMAWRLLKVHEARTVRIVIAGLWIVSLGFVLLEFVAIGLLSGIPIGAMLAASAPDIGRSAIFAAIWTAYFSLSKRVANTYRNRGGEEMAEVFS